MPGPRALGAVSANVPAISGFFPVNDITDLARAIVLTEQAGSIGTAHLLRAVASGRIALLPLLPDKLAVTQPYLQRRVEHLHVLSQLWEKESRAGPRCFVGRFEGCGILVSPRRNDSDPTAPPSSHDFALFLRRPARFAPPPQSLPLQAQPRGPPRRMPSAVGSDGISNARVATLARDGRSFGSAIPRSVTVTVTVTKKSGCAAGE